MTPQELKASILQLAVQGKLVEQRPEEGTGKELFRQIQAEKQTLIKAGKIKKEKPLPDIAEDEIPFDIPDSWEWIKLGNIVSVLGGKRIPAGRTLTIENTGHVFIRISDMKNGSVVTDNLMYVPDDIYPSISRYIINSADIYITVAGTIGRVGKIPKALDGANLTENADRLVFMLVDQDWLIHTLESSLVQSKIADATTKVGQPKLAIKRIQELIIPLPPLAEQKRIVAKIEELLPYIDRYGQAWSKLENFNKRFPADMQKSILQMAIQGKLVEQRPEEGTGEELYRQIQAEKQALIKAGKIKKEKPLPQITDEETPFDIPASWKWYRMGELFNIVNGFTPLKSNPEFWTDGDIPWFTIEDVHRQGRFISSTEKFITRKALSKNTERIVPADTVLLCCTASVGEYAYAKIALTTNQQFNAFVVKEYCQNVVYPLFVFEYAKTLKGSLIGRAGKTTFNFVSVGKLSNMLIPLPPLAEQKRIVAKLEEILPLCERLK